MSVNIFWFRRDLRLTDNHALWEALNSGKKVLPIFIFDDNILRKLKEDDRRVTYIHEQVTRLDSELRSKGSLLMVMTGSPVDIFRKLPDEFEIESVFTNRDYEPYAVERDTTVSEILALNGCKLLTFGDQLIFEPGEVIKPDGTPYTVFTPFSKKWLELFRQKGLTQYVSEKLMDNLLPSEEIAMHSKVNDNSGVVDQFNIPSIDELGFQVSVIPYPVCKLDAEKVINYARTRDIPSLDSTTRIGLCLRFGTISIRECVAFATRYSESWLNELVWREFFMHILAHYPLVVDNAFRPKYDNIRWINNEDMFQHWCNGTTGYPMVDAGMRELKATGFMHNRVRMVTASFLVKHLLIDWRWGEAWFAEHLLDFELSSNNGNWQWAAGSGCDAAPYFRIFNPQRQQERFDPEFMYIKKWVPEFGTDEYPEPVIDHDFARRRCITVYSEAVR